MDTDSSCEGSRYVQAEVDMAAFALTNYFNFKFSGGCHCETQFSGT